MADGGTFIGDSVTRDLYQLMRGELDADSMLFPLPRFSDIGRGIEFVRIERLSRFWKQKGDGQAGAPLERAIEDLVCGLYGQRCEWMLILRGHVTPRGSRLGCWFGARGGASIGTQLSGAFPGLRYAPDAWPDFAEIDDLPNALRLTGVPSPKQTAPGPTDWTPDQIDKVCRALLGTNWVFVVHGSPIGRGEVIRAVNAMARHIADVQAIHMLRQSPGSEPNRLVKQQIELLEARFKSLETARTLGCWSTRIWLATEFEQHLMRGLGLLHSAFGGDKPVESIRAIRCAPRAVESDPVLSWLPPLTWLSTPEAAHFASPPRDSYPGYLVTDFVRFGVETQAGIAETETSQAQIQIGEITDHGRSNGNHFQVPIDDLAKHGLIVGVTGSGKTNTSFQILEQLAANHIPFLIIESAKSEYRHLLSAERFAGMRVFTVGDETSSPLRLNPFEVPRGIKVQTHIDYLKSLFSAAFVLYPPMPYVLEQSLNEVYRDRGWDLALGENERGATSLRRFPTVSDLAAKIETVVDRMGYDERITMDVKAGLVARLDQFRTGGGKGPMLNTRFSIRPEELFRTQCLIELKLIVDDDEKAFLIGLLLMRLYEFYESGASGPPNGSLRHVTVIEEAHRLLRNVSMEQGGEVSANPKGRAIEVFSNILSEVRAYGEGMLIAEQIPVKLVPDAIKNTNLKIVHRLVAEDDRKLVGGTMNLEEAQIRSLMTLSAGEALVYREGMQSPAAVNIILSDTKRNLTTVDQERVADSYWPSWRSARIPFVGCRNCRSARPGRSCAERRARATGNLGLAFHRLYSAMRLQPTAIKQRQAEFREACAALDPYCAFVELADGELEQEGDFFRWSYEDIDRLVELACACSLLENALESSALVEFSRFCERIYPSSAGPFSGCSACLRPCHYRYDMEAVVASRTGTRAKQLLDELPDLQELVPIARSAAGELFLENDPPLPGGEPLKGAAVCFAAQLCNDLGLSGDEQAELCGLVATHFDDIFDEAVDQDGVEEGENGDG